MVLAQKSWSKPSSVIIPQSDQRVLCCFSSTLSISFSFSGSPCGSKWSLYLSYLTSIKESRKQRRLIRRKCWNKTKTNFTVLPVLGNFPRNAIQWVFLMPHEHSGLQRMFGNFVSLKKEFEMGTLPPPNSGISKINGEYEFLPRVSLRVFCVALCAILHPGPFPLSL